MSPPSSYAHWNQPRSQSPHGSVELDDEGFSESSSVYSELVSSEFELEDDEFHEEEFAGILALAELAKESFATSSRGEDLEDYIAYLRDALTVAPRDGQVRADILHSLAYNLYLSVANSHASSFDPLERLNESIHLHRLALYHLSHGNDARATYATCLAVVLRERYSRSGDPDDLHDSIALHLQVLSFRPPGHPDRFESLTNLANCHFACFECLEESNDLESAVKYDSEALCLLTPDHPKRISALLALAADHGARFWKDELQDDFHRSRALYEEALLLTTTVEDNLRIAQQLASLLFTHYRTNRIVAILDQAIEVCSRPFYATHDISPTTQLPAIRLLADLCLTQYIEGSQEARYLEGAIQYSKRALNYLPEASSLSDRLNALMNLSYALVARFSLTNVADDIEQSIQLCTEAGELSPSGYPSHPRSLRALARSFAIRYEHFHDDHDLQLAFGRYAEAVRDPYGFTRERITWAEEWVELILRHRGQSKLLLEAYMPLLGLLRHLIYFEEDPHLREEDIRTAARVFSGCLQCALHLQDTETVVELVEQRQQMLWRPRYLDDAIPTPLRQRLHSIACELHGSYKGHSSPASLVPSRIRHAGSDDVASRHRNLVDEFHSLVQHLRQYPGLSDLLHPVRFSDLVLDHEHDPVVILIAQARCEAIICRSSGVSRVSLNFTAEDARKVACAFHDMRQGVDEAKFQRLSGLTWDAVVGPVLSALEYTHRTFEPKPKPRVWWCPTGPFTFIPLHAVGHSQAGKQSVCTFDYVVSSYIPSINSLRIHKSKDVECRQKKSLPAPNINTDLPALETTSSKKDDIHLVQIPSPIGSDGLSFSFGYDIDHSSEGQRASFIRLTGPLPDDILATSPQTDSSHLSYSSTTSNLPHLALSYVAFAFLYTQTRPSHASYLTTRAPGLPCESAHPGFALLLGGFRSILSTLPGWENVIHASDTAMVIERVCRGVESMDASDSSLVSYALDNAIRSLRDSGVPLSRLIPFIHIGL
ncbi:hypothetical protein BDY19DRAFT_990808 [Irpex rosettiformis]|uniref:Uncharacterized protein n=1 Tax=Irpex rosettiformis TaxID=378272 RepID=A0ACB8UCT0_9APHY|nr:hypothetical protein BDY19DRAFT_990808 [Irpex rosettiformis]